MVHAFIVNVVANLAYQFLDSWVRTRVPLHFLAFLLNINPASGSVLANVSDFHVDRAVCDLRLRINHRGMASSLPPPLFFF